MLTTPLGASLLRRMVREFQWTTRFADLTVVVFFGAYALLFAAVAIFGEVLLCRIGGALLFLGLGYTILRLTREGWVGAIPSSSAAIECSAYYRAQLVRRRDFKKQFLYWAVLPVIPGAAVGTLGWVVADPKQWYIPSGALFFCLSVLFLSVDGSRKDAVRMQKEIDLLDGAR